MSSTTAKVTVTENIRELPRGNRRWQVRWKVDGCREKTQSFSIPQPAAGSVHLEGLPAASIVPPRQL